MQEKGIEIERGLALDLSKIILHFQLFQFRTINEFKLASVALDFRGERTRVKCRLKVTMPAQRINLKARMLFVFFFCKS